MHIARISA